MRKISQKTYYRKECVKTAKTIAKIRDKWICQRCGKPVEGSDAHGSHIYPEGTYRNMSALVENILCLCFDCHINWWHKYPKDAKDWFNKRYKELAFFLEKEAKESINKKINWQSLLALLREKLNNMQQGG